MLTVGVVFWFSYCAQAELTADYLISRIEKEGAINVVGTLWNDQKTWQEAMGNIAKGDRKWLEAARVLRAGTDAGATLDLDFAVAEALPKSTLHVLRLIDGTADPHSFGKETFSVFDVCRIPFIDETEEQDNDAREFLAKAEKSLVDVQIPPDASKLEVIRQNCLNEVRTWIGKFR